MDENKTTVHNVNLNAVREIITRVESTANEYTKFLSNDERLVLYKALVMSFAKQYKNLEAFVKLFHSA
mgnify:FL=1